MTLSAHTAHMCMLTDIHAFPAHGIITVGATLCTLRVRFTSNSVLDTSIRLPSERVVRLRRYAHFTFAGALPRHWAKYCAFFFCFGVWFSVADMFRLLQKSAVIPTGVHNHSPRGVQAHVNWVGCALPVRRYVFG